MKKTKRLIVYIFLFAALVISSKLITKAYYISEWNTIASCMAVITAIIATFASLRIIWKQEDDLEPEIIIYFDSDSRSNITQLVIKNIGGSNAYDIKLEWNKALYGDNGDIVTLPEVPVIYKDHCVRYLIGIGATRFEKAKAENSKLIYSGILRFKYSKTRKWYTKQKFEIGLEQNRMKVRPVTDEQNFYIKNLDINENLTKLNQAINKLASPKEE